MNDNANANSDSILDPEKEEDFRNILYWRAQDRAYFHIAVVTFGPFALGMGALTIHYFGRGETGGAVVSGITCLAAATYIFWRYSRL